MISRQVSRAALAAFVVSFSLSIAAVGFTQTITVGVPDPERLVEQWLDPFAFDEPVSSGIDGPWAHITPTTFSYLDNAVISNGTTLYNFGGFNYANYDNGDPWGGTVQSSTGGAWATLQSAPDDLEWTVRAAINGDYVYVTAGGIDGDMAPDTNTFYRYQISTNTWTTRANVPNGRTWATQLVADGGYIYLVGGGYISSLDGDFIASNQLRRYSIAGNSWASLRNMPASRGFHCAFAYSGKIYVIGGHNGSTGQSTSWIYDIAGDTWTNDPVTLGTRHFGGACIQADTGGKTIIIASGVEGSPEAITQNTWIRHLSIGGPWQNFGLVPSKVYRTGGAAIGLTAYLVQGAYNDIFDTNFVQSSPIPTTPSTTTTTTSTTTTTKTTTTTTTPPTTTTTKPPTTTTSPTTTTTNPGTTTTTAPPTTTTTPATTTTTTPATTTTTTVPGTTTTTSVPSTTSTTTTTEPDEELDDDDDTADDSPVDFDDDFAEDEDEQEGDDDDGSGELSGGCGC
ncbi:hypothetical protein K8I61_13615 [bacterium]|nr:hypothetical protein [bacterium]